MAGAGLIRTTTGYSGNLYCCLVSEEDRDLRHCFGAVVMEVDSAYAVKDDRNITVKIERREMQFLQYDAITNIFRYNIGRKVSTFIRWAKRCDRVCS